MLDIFRKKAQSKIIQATVLIIAIVFIFWGVGGQQRTGSNEIAVVNDETIPYQEYRRTFEQLTSTYRDQLGGSLSEEMIKTLNLKEQAIEQMVQAVLLRQGAAEMGLLTSKQEVKETIEQMAAFQNNGAFDLNQYKAALAASRMTPPSFEASLRNDLIAKQVVAAIGRIAKVSPTAARDRFRYEHSESNLEYVRFAADDFKEKARGTEEELAAYYEKNKENYKTEPLIKINYLTFLVQDDEADAQIADDEVTAFYQQNMDRYSVPEQRAVRNILIKVEPDAAAQVVDTKRRLAEEVLAKATAGQDFAELAKQYSEGPAAEQGGALGAVSRGRLMKPLDDALFALAEGAVSDLVKTNFGFHILKVEKILPGQTRPLDEVRQEIVASLTQSKAGNQTFARANKAYEEIILAGSLAKYGETAKVEVAKTDFFQKNAPPAAGNSPAILKNQAFLDAAFALKKGELSSLVKLDQGYAIIFAEDSKTPETQPLAVVKEKVVADYAGERTKTLAREAAEALLAAGKAAPEHEAWLKEIKKTGKTLAETGFISRTNPGPTATQTLPAPLLEKGLRLSPATPYPETIEAKETTFYVYRLKEKKEPADAAFEEQRTNIEKQLLEGEKMALLAGWLKNMKSNAKIVTNDKLL